MPIYEYKCEGCGEVFELIQKFADEPLTVHEKCGGHVHRLMSAPSFQFKGTGWYVTDYAKGGASGAPRNESGKGDSGKGDSSKNEPSHGDSGKSEGKSDSSSKSSEAGSSAETKSESKPAATSEKSKSD